MRGEREQALFVSKLKSKFGSSVPTNFVLDCRPTKEIISYNLVTRDHATNNLTSAWLVIAGYLDQEMLVPDVTPAYNTPGVIPSS